MEKPEIEVVTVDVAEIGEPLSEERVGPRMKYHVIASADATAMPASSNRRVRPAAVPPRGISSATPTQLNG